MHYSLIMLGAHDGSKTEEIVKGSIQFGPALLIEAVPYLYEKLRKRYSQDLMVKCLNEVISPTGGNVDFFMLPEDAKLINSAATQLGSLNSDHAPEHGAELRDLQIKITCPSRTISSLIDDLGITSIDTLWSDMEGSDVITLINFPFSRVRPRQILFEAKHSDGVMRSGKNLATFLLILEALGYQTMMASSEDFLAFDTLASSNDSYLRIRP
jgi:FkbM family methyltransferase